MADVRSREAATTNQQFRVQASPCIGKSIVDTRACNIGRSSQLMYTTPIVTNETSKERSGMSNNYSDVTGFAKLDHLRFNGDKIKEWLFQIEQFFLIDHIPEELKVSFASIHFDDLAATWHQWILQSVLWKHVRHDWVTYKMLLQGRFKELEVDPIVELKKLQETDGIEDFHKKFELIKSQVNLSEAYLVSVYLAGLRPDTQLNVRMFQPQTIQHCFMLGRLYETAHPTSVIISTESDDYQKGVQPLDVSSKVAGTSMSNDGICMIDNDENQFLSGSDLVENEVEEVKKDLVEIDGEMSSDDDQISDAGEVFGFNVEECLGNIHVPNALHKVRECFEGKHSIQQENFVGMENFLQQEELNCDFEDFAKTDATMNQLQSPIGFVVDELQSCCGSDVVRVQNFASLVVVGDFQETPWILNAESKVIPSCHIAIDEGSDTYACQEFDGILLRNHTIHQQKKPSKYPKSWKFKFKIISEDIKSRYTKVWCEKATRNSQKKLQCGKSWKFNYKSRRIQSELVIIKKIQVDKESVEMLRRCNSGQVIGAYGSEIKRWDIHIRVWDPGGIRANRFSESMADVRSREAATTNQQFRVQASPCIGKSIVDTRACNIGRSSQLMYTTPIVTNETSKERSGMSNNYSDVTGFAKLDHLRFNGDKIKEWLFQIEQFFLIDHIPEELKVSFASIHFDDLAATWHQWILQSVLWKHVRHDWVTYKMLLQGRFKELEVDPIVELKKLQETDGIEDFHKKFELIKSQVNLSEAYLVSVYLAGLRPDTQLNVRMFQPQTIQHCFMLGRLYETAHPTSVIISTESDDYQKGVQPLDVSSKVAGTSMSNDGICMIDNDENQFLSGSDLVENEVEEVKKDLVEIDGEMSSDDDQISDAGEVFGFNVEECLGNIHVPNALHKVRECFEGKHSIQQENFVGMENFLQQEELNCDFEDFAKTDATMNQLQSPIGFVVDELQSCCGSDVVRVQNFASLVVVGDFQETPWILNAESKVIPSCHIAIDEGSDTYACQEFDGILLRNHTIHQQKKPSKYPKSWKFKFKIISEDIKSRYTKVWCEKATRNSQKKLQCGKSWKFNYKSRRIQSELVIIKKIQVDKESVEMLRRCNSGQVIGAYGSEIKRWDIHIRVWDPGGSCGKTLRPTLRYAAKKFERRLNSASELKSCD
ncbi:Retrotransposon gag domain [Arabidopsis thaliana x Arabidopsis arenosa]|uniref:Retrotransposon gag domain n=1 Tax=Arabidopsis thaliana x Arabidopsis arenosa TaxID=1240361 RepID=A0A8T1YBB7_9BRAS|nr:Retrotransposon gag domain [Arabidopsis thaliana x Arabidopsis arenosa]